MYCQGSEFKTNCFKTQIMHRTVFPTTVFYSLPFVLFVDKAPSLFLIFFCIADGHIPFQLDIYSTVFLGAQKACQANT